MTKDFSDIFFLNEKDMAVVDNNYLEVTFREPEGNLTMLLKFQTSPLGKSLKIDVALDKDFQTLAVFWLDKNFELNVDDLDSFASGLSTSREFKQELSHVFQAVVSGTDFATMILRNFLYFFETELEK